MKKNSMVGLSNIYKVEVNKNDLNNHTITLKNNKNKKHKINRLYLYGNLQQKIIKGAEFHIPNKSPQ